MKASKLVYVHDLSGWTTGGMRPLLVRGEARHWQVIRQSDGAVLFTGRTWESCRVWIGRNT